MRIYIYHIDVEKEPNNEADNREKKITLKREQDIQRIVLCETANDSIEEINEKTKKMSKGEEHMAS